MQPTETACSRRCASSSWPTPARPCRVGRHEVVDVELLEGGGGHQDAPPGDAEAGVAVEDPGEPQSLGGAVGDHLEELRDGPAGAELLEHRGGLRPCGVSGGEVDDLHAGSFGRATGGPRS